MTDLNKFNSKSGFDFDLNNITSKIRLDFDTNVENPTNYILGINDTQDQFILVDPNELTNTNIIENTLDLSVLEQGYFGDVNHYVFEKLINPATVGCSNCDSSTDVNELFLKTGNIPTINNEVIAEFEISPSAIHTLEIDLVGHRKVCDDSGNCYDTWNTLGEEFIPKKLIATPPYPNTVIDREFENAFIDYSCCPCCEAEYSYQQGLISIEKRNEICETSNVYIKSTVAFPTFYDYCHNLRYNTILETNQVGSTSSICDLIESSKYTYGTQIDTTLSHCSTTAFTASFISATGPNTNPTLPDPRPPAPNLFTGSGDTGPYNPCEKDPTTGRYNCGGNCLALCCCQEDRHHRDAGMPDGCSLGASLGCSIPCDSDETKDAIASNRCGPVGADEIRIYSGCCCLSSSCSECEDPELTPEKCAECKTACESAAFCKEHPNHPDCCSWPYQCTTSGGGGGGGGGSDCTTNPCSSGCPNAGTCACDPTQCTNPCDTDPCGAGCSGADSCQCNPARQDCICAANPCAGGCADSGTCRCDPTVCGGGGGNPGFWFCGNRCTNTDDTDKKCEYWEPVPGNEFPPMCEATVGYRCDVLNKYSTQTECINKCKCYYDCRSGGGGRDINGCSYAGFEPGTYSNLQTCRDSCLTIPLTYNCVNFSCQEVTDGSGFFASRTACQAQCGTYSCPATGPTASCVFVSENANGYSNRNECDLNCKTTWCCNGYAPGCVIDPLATCSTTSCTEVTIAQCLKNGQCSNAQTFTSQLDCLQNSCCGGKHWECKFKPGQTQDIPGAKYCAEIEGIKDPTIPSEYSTEADCKAVCGKSYYCESCSCNIKTGLNGSETGCDTSCTIKTYRCDNGQCIQDVCPTPANPGLTYTQCKLQCGRWRCPLTSPATSNTPCTFVGDTAVGYTDQATCLSQTYCNITPRYVCEIQTCPSRPDRPTGSLCVQTYSEDPTLTYYNTFEECRDSACMDGIDQGPRYKCVNNDCKFIDYCDGDGDFTTIESCRESCWGWNCKNNICTQEAGSTINHDTCSETCHCKFKKIINSNGCAECKKLCGRNLARDNRTCDEWGANCTDLTNYFNTETECVNDIRDNDEGQYVCLKGGSCGKIEDNPDSSTYCNTYCNKQLCTNSCEGGYGFKCNITRCIPTNGCEIPDYSSEDECNKYCGVTPNGFNCKLVNNVYTCIAAIPAQTDEGTGSSGSTGEFPTLNLCKTFCINDFGWNCKGNNCVKAIDAPGQYKTYTECAKSCIIPNQGPCGDEPSSLEATLINNQQFNSYSSNLNIPPIENAPVSSFFAPINYGLLHDNRNVGILPGYCENYIFPQYNDSYQKSLDYSCENYTDLYYYNTNVNCSTYWNRKLNIESSDYGSSVDTTTTTNAEFASSINKFNTRSMHWLNGGYFYGVEGLRSNIYEEKGTIHFNTSVKYDIVDSTLEQALDFIPDFSYNGVRRLYSHEIQQGLRFTNGKIFKLNPAANSLSFSYNIFKVKGTFDIPVIVPIIKYNNITKAFASASYEDVLSVSDCGSRNCDSNTLRSSVYSDNILVMLSTGNITHYPLSNEQVNYTAHNTASFIMVDNVYNTFYYDFVTPIKNVYTKYMELLKCDISPTLNNNYFISNSIDSPYPIVTTSITLTDGILSYPNHKFRCSILGDSTTDEPYLILKNDSGLLYNQYNEKDESDSAFNVLIKILDYIKINYPDATLHMSLYEDSLRSPTILDKNKNILDPGTLYVSHEIIDDPEDTRPNQKVIKFKLSKPIKNATYFNKTLSSLMKIGNRSTWLLMIKASSMIGGYRNNTIETTSAVNKDISETEIKYEPMSPISVISETTLFNETSTRFSTPDYTSIRSYTNEIIPLRGSEYSTNELSNYPRIRYVRKVDGKFYIQVLAGAFPYYHSLVHYPAIKELEKCTTTMQTQGLCVGRVVENSLKKICGKSTDWYNHVASTKWMCHIKHTQFGSDPIEYTETETTKQIITGPNQKYIGKTPQGSIYAVIGNPNTGTGNGLGISNPAVGSVVEEELRTEAR